MKGHLPELLVITILVALICGCSAPTSPFNSTTPTQSPSANATPQPSQSTVLVYGHVYLGNISVKGATVEAISDDGSDSRSAVTGDDGSYVLNIIKEKAYKITAGDRGLRHSVWPVYLPGDIDQFDINLTVVPRSTIEGTGYMIGGPSPGMYDHKPGAGFVMEARSVNDNNNNVTSITDGNGKYSLEVLPGVLYNITGNISEQNPYPIAMFHYRNDAPHPPLGQNPQIQVGDNETILVDYIIPVP